MQIPFYQTIWNDISLVELAKELDHPLENLPNENFYRAYYKKFRDSFFSSNNWRIKKQEQTIWLKEQIEKYGNINSQIISIGAGTGIIEIPLIENSYNIHLQEFQEESFDILNASSLTKCYIGDFNKINKSQYDIAVSIAMTYAVPDEKISLFFKSCKELLKNKGKLIILDTSLSWWEIYSHFRNRNYYKKNKLLWGVKRSAESYKFNSSDFKFLCKEYYDNNMNKLDVKNLFGTPYNVTPCWQMIVLEKND